MIYSYLFEAKSIQSYLFKSGKLKDVIAASERIDKLIDSSEHSALYQVLQSAKIQSDLLDYSHVESTDLVRFLRCKGGAFYAFSQNKAPLLKLRSLWTLTVQQLFPGLEFTDALTEASSLRDSIQQGQQELMADRNTPYFKFPLGTAICERNSRSGGVNIPASLMAAEDKDGLDLDTELHRQAYQTLNMREQAALQDRFTPDELSGTVAYPINLEKDFQFSVKNCDAENKEAIKDIALVHIDGNGLGNLLITLNQTLKSHTDEEYRKGFRQFSDAISSATIAAAKAATHWLYKNSAYLYKAEKDKVARTYIPMRPLVLGGDDLTLLCRADMALEYSQRFCREFRRSSKNALAPLFKDYLTNAGIESFLTASGGILYQKAGHPFIQSHHLVEDLCLLAKKLTKKTDPSGKKVGPAALALFRQSKAASLELETLREQSQYFMVQDNHQRALLKLGLSAYYVDEDAQQAADKHGQNLVALERLAFLARSKNTPVSINKWRQMASHLSLGNKTEADRIFHRANNKANDPASTSEMLSLIKTISGKNDLDSWYWPLSDQGDNEAQVNSFQTIISDLLLVDHFRPVMPNTDTASKEAR